MQLYLASFLGRKEKQQQRRGEDEHRKGAYMMTACTTREGRHFWFSAPWTHVPPRLLLLLFLLVLLFW